MNHIFVAGTFDHLHKGHQSILEKAFEMGEKVTIGITSDTFVQTVKQPLNPSVIQSFLERKEAIEKWIKAGASNTPYEIIPIEDQYEPAASGPFDSLIITTQNRKTGEEINAKREAQGLSLLTLIELPLVEATDGKPISSTRVRAGEIDTEGHLFLPDHMRLALQEALGPIVTTEEISIHSRREGGTVITVGDFTTKAAISQGVFPQLAVIDLHVQRQPYISLEAFQFPINYAFYETKSGPGFISSDAVRLIRESLESDQKTVIVVSGEDDLLVLPIILIAKEGSLVYYGQPNVGCVEVFITAEKKQQVQKILDGFEKK